MGTLGPGDVPDEVEYRLRAWSAQERGLLVAGLVGNGIRHRFEQGALIVAASDEEHTDMIVRALGNGHLAVVEDVASPAPDPTASPQPPTAPMAGMPQPRPQATTPQRAPHPLAEPAVRPTNGPQSWARQAGSTRTSQPVRQPRKAARLGSVIFLVSAVFLAWYVYADRPAQKLHCLYFAVSQAHESLPWKITCTLNGVR